MVIVRFDGDQRYDHGSTFSDDKPHNGKTDGGRKSPLQADIINEIHTSDAHDLFGKLTDRRHNCFFDAVKIAVDAGVNRGHGDRQCDNAKQRSSPSFQQERNGNLIGKAVDENRAQNGNCHGNQKTGE